nr:basic proline-rich protein-like [Globicephala melas]
MEEGLDFEVRESSDETQELFQELLRIEQRFSDNQGAPGPCPPIQYWALFWDPNDPDTKLTLKGLGAPQEQLDRSAGQLRPLYEESPAPRPSPSQRHPLGRQGSRGAGPGRQHPAKAAKVTLLAPLRRAAGVTPCLERVPAATPPGPASAPLARRAPARARPAPRPYLAPGSSSAAAAAASCSAHGGRQGPGSGEGGAQGRGLLRRRPPCRASEAEGRARAFGPRSRAAAAGAPTKPARPRPPAPARARRRIPPPRGRELGSRPGRGEEGGAEPALRKRAGGCLASPSASPRPRARPRAGWAGSAAGALSPPEPRQRAPRAGAFAAPSGPPRPPPPARTLFQDREGPQSRGRMGGQQRSNPEWAAHSHYPVPPTSTFIRASDTTPKDRTPHVGAPGLACPWEEPVCTRDKANVSGPLFLKEFFKLPLPEAAAPQGALQGLPPRLAEGDLHQGHVRIIHTGSQHLSTFPRQTPGWAPRKGRFYLESPPELGLEECTKVLCSPQGAVSRPTPKTNTLPRGALTTRRKQPDFHGPAGGGGRHLLGTGEKCARCPLLALVPE